VGDVHAVLPVDLSRAPFVETLRGSKALAGALSAITAAVCGVISLAIWFAIHRIFSRNRAVKGGSYDWSVRRAAAASATRGRSLRGSRGPGVFRSNSGCYGRSRLLCGGIVLFSPAFSMTRGLRIVENANPNTRRGRSLPNRRLI